MAGRVTSRSDDSTTAQASELRALVHAENLALQHFLATLALEGLGNLDKARNGLPHFLVITANFLALAHPNLG